VNGSGLSRLPAMTNHCLFQGGSRFARGGKQSLNESPGLVGLKLNQIALIDNLAGNFPDMHDYKFSHRASLNRGCFLEKLFVRRRHPGDKPLAFWLCYYRWHVSNVCLRGTHGKN
jgi:hypothetical protein